jgi:hypothetical protein
MNRSAQAMHRELIAAPVQTLGAPSAGPGHPVQRSELPAAAQGGRAAIELHGRRSEVPRRAPAPALLWP